MELKVLRRDEEFCPDRKRLQGSTKRNRVSRADKAQRRRARQMGARKLGGYHRHLRYTVLIEADPSQAGTRFREKSTDYWLPWSSGKPRIPESYDVPLCPTFCILRGPADANLNDGGSQLSWEHLVRNGIVELLDTEEQEAVMVLMTPEGLENSRLQQQGIDPHKKNVFFSVYVLALFLSPITINYGHISDEFPHPNGHYGKYPPSSSETSRDNSVNGRLQPGRLRHFKVLSIVGIRGRKAEELFVRTFEGALDAVRIDETQEKAETFIRKLSQAVFEDSRRNLHAKLRHIEPLPWYPLIWMHSLILWLVFPLIKLTKLAV
ncbi:hypothetical protein FB446DRAFT_795614 [Lentinula raphanica]|nr:hypothetical protein FB446DRAFT_795614 [Lentinula raphanica]